MIWLEGSAGRMTVGGRTVKPERGVAIGINSFEPHNHTFADGEIPGQFLAFYIDWDWLASRRGLRAGTQAFLESMIELETWLVEVAQPPG